MNFLTGDDAPTPEEVEGTGPAPMAVGFSEDEARVMDLISEAMRGIQRLNGRRLAVNGEELGAAVHVLQGFVIQGAHARLRIFGASDWWRDE